MAGGKVGRAQAPRLGEADAEFDLAVAQHVRVGRATGGVLAQEVREDPLAVLAGEACPVQGDPELGGDRAGVLEVLGGRAVGVIVLRPSCS